MKRKEHIKKCLLKTARDQGAPLEFPRGVKSLWHLCVLIDEYKREKSIRPIIGNKMFNVDFLLDKYGFDYCKTCNMHVKQKKVKICFPCRKALRLYKEHNLAEVCSYKEFMKSDMRAVIRNAELLRQHKVENSKIVHTRQEKLKLGTLRGYRKEIKEIYANRPKGWHVDPIIPICGKNVCGLHVPWNMQYLPADINRRKSNKC